MRKRIGFGDDNDREWSDDRGFLESVGWLINKAHEASMDPGNDVYDWFWILQQLQLEIIGQLTFRSMTDDIKNLNELRNKINGNLEKAYAQIGKHDLSTLSPSSATKLRMIVYPYHEMLNILIHKMDLRLHDVSPKNENLPDWAEN